MNPDPLEVASCPLCGSLDSREFDRRVFRGIRVTNRICQGCGLVYQSPRMSQEELDRFYASEYRTLYQGDAAPVKRDLAVQKARAADLVQFGLSAGIKQLGRHLDIGSSAGLLLQAFSDTFHTQAVGVEPGIAYQAIAQQAGLKVYSNIEDLSHQVEAGFDLVTIIHVLEHLPDPVGTLELIRNEWLNPDGWLMVEVPNLYCHDSFEVAHLTSFSQHTFEQVLHKAGFEIHARRHHGKPRSKLLPLYITLLARPASRSNSGETWKVNPESSVALKRHWGMFNRKLVEKLLPGSAWVEAAKGD